MRTINQIVDKVNTKYGAPMGRSNVTPQNVSIVMGGKRDFIADPLTKKSKVIFDCAVPMSDGAYDKGGAYWGLGNQLRVSYTKDLTYIKFYRKGDK